MSATDAAALGFDDPALIAFAELGRTVALPARDGVIARFSDMELIDAVALRDGEFVLETSSRGGKAHPVVSSGSIAPARRALVLRLGSAVRSRLRLPRFDLPVDPSALPAGFELRELPDRAELRWEHAGAPVTVVFHSGQSAVHDAVKYAQLARASEADLMTAFRDPNARAWVPLVE